ncbi:MAG: glycoside hydrolase [Maribacter sp.]|nr:MAG: glycoside hydrolase [Maribacter sp.]
MKRLFLSILLLIPSIYLIAQNTFEIKGLCISAPPSDKVGPFIDFIENELVPNGINTLVLRVDYNYAYESRPELRGENPLSKVQIKQIVDKCKKSDIKIVPQINLLGHQSWHSKHHKLLQVYPEFDETPHIALPKDYVWPNDDGLYCKSYCPLHPNIHEVVFDLVDEILDVFETDAFHAGMDEVFYLADDNCPRCKGKDPAALFANELIKINDHLAHRGARLWIWGDRLIDGAITGIGPWEASMNNTARAIDMIPKSIVICDWHYEKAIPTAAYFAIKGFDVVTCPWNKPDVAIAQVRMMRDLKLNSTPEMATHYLGMMQTYWSSTTEFIEEQKQASTRNRTTCFKAMVNTMKAIELSNEQ